MISSNPFSMTFGIEPNNYISRKTIQDKIVEEFTADSPSNFVYLLSGVRGSGKTVLLSNLSEKFSSFSNFIVVDPFNKANILESIASRLYEHKEVKRVFVKKTDFLFFPRYIPEPLRRKTHFQRRRFAKGDDRNPSKRRQKNFDYHRRSG